MSGNDDFELWLGRIGDRGRSSSGRFTSRVIRSANLAGGRRVGSASARRFDGSRIGRGSATGRLLGSTARRFAAHARRVVVKTSIVRLGPKGAVRASAHMRYLQRDGTTREGERGVLYSADLDRADGGAFVERGQHDRHQFRFIVSPEDGSEYEDLKPVVRRLMEQAERDLGTKLDWVAVDHFNTGRPHSHVIIRGKDELGKDLVIAREYLTHGLRERAAGIVSLDLGPRSEWEIARANAREIGQERFTRLDRRILRSRDPDGLVDPRHRDPAERDLRVARLRRLADMGLAEESGSGRWRVREDLEPTLRRMGQRGDIIATLNRELGKAMPDRGPQDQAIYDAERGERLVGRLVATGLSDEHADRRYLILDATDGRTHYVDIGELEIDIQPGSVLAIGARPAQAREVDRTVANVAAANGGLYSSELHLANDSTASEAFVAAHVRRLEAIRRVTGGVTRDPDGIWRIAPDHLDRAEAYERRRSAQTPVIVQALSDRAIDDLPNYDGPTWLDRELVDESPERLGRGFGADVRKALERRRQWLIAQGLAEELDDGCTRYRAGLMRTLERREVHRVAARLSKELGTWFSEPVIGERIEGKLSRAVIVGNRKFALVERAFDFSLVRWAPELEQQIGRQVGGIVRDGGISWTIGRERGIEISM